MAEVVLPDGAELGYELVRAGLAWWYRRYAPESTDLEKLEREARAANKGLWSDPRAVPPWDWRRKGRGVVAVP